MRVLQLAGDTDDAARRRLLYRGHVVMLEPSPASLALLDRIRQLFTAEFADPIDYSDLSALPRFARAARNAKAAVGGDPLAGELLKQLLTSLGCDPLRTYRHRLFLRAVPPLGHLGAAAPYHAAPHRDTWLSAAPSQVNWWMAASRVCERSSLVFYPRAWAQAVANNSHQFDYGAYKARFLQVHRSGAVPSPGAAGAVTPPQTIEPMPAHAGIRVSCPPGALILFSAAHLHGSAPNTSGHVRVSADVRTCDIDDLVANRGPENVDAACAGSNLVDFRRVSDGAALAVSDARRRAGPSRSCSPM